MTKLKIREFSISGNQVESCSGSIYSKVGLKVKYKNNKLTIRSTKKTKITSIHKSICVEINDIPTIKDLIEEGFCCDHEYDESSHSDTKYSNSSSSGHKCLPLEMIDELGNKIVATFFPKSSIRNIGVLTSGGDSPGMNCAIRAILRTSKKWGSNIYGIYYGYDGLINDKIEELGWDSIGPHSFNGGTFLLSARSSSFMSKEGRRKATFNLVKRQIDGLIVMGGDGSIKGGMVLKKEFQNHIKDLYNEGLVSADCLKMKLKLIVIPASIDNDITNSDMTLGADSCLNRITECIDSLCSTMVSHQRSFVVEVMGRDCGWIALMTHFAVCATYVFLPEAPAINWKKDLVGSISKARQDGKLGAFIIVSEGACDVNGERIKAETVKEVIENESGVECRVLKLGHIQRGGNPSAFDRILSTLLGCKAVETMLTDTNDEPLMATLFEGKYRMIPLQKVIDDNARIESLQKEKMFGKVLKERGLFFNRVYALSEQLRTGLDTSKKKGKLAVIHNGQRAAGMNVALHIIVRYGISLNQEVYVIQNGFDGLIANQIEKARPYDYVSGIRDGGSIIGSCITGIVDIKKVYEKIIEHEITSLIMIGGSSSLQIINDLKKMMVKNNKENIDIILIPSTIHNSIPFTDSTLGADTALNIINIGCDFMRLSSMSLIKTVFVIEVYGEESGYLALFGGIAAGAFDTFIPERKYMISHLSECARRLKLRFRRGNRHGILLIKNQSTFSGVSSESFSKIITTDSENLYNAKYCVFGDLIQGGRPSPYDRIYATVFGIKSVDILLGKDKENILDGTDKHLVGVIGSNGRSLRFTDIEKCLEEFEDISKKKKKPAWLKYANICRSLE